MGLFDSRETKAAKDSLTQLAREEVMQKLAKCEVTDWIIKSIVETAEKENSENAWITQCQNYYDKCARKVTIMKDSLEIKWYTTHSERYVAGRDSNGREIIDTKTVEDVFGEKRWSFTKSGYLPLHSYRSDHVINEKTGDVAEVSEADVLVSLAKIVQEKLAAAMPAFRFKEIPSETSDKSAVSFFYYVPRLTWKDWF